VKLKTNNGRRRIGCLRRRLGGWLRRRRFRNERNRRNRDRRRRKNRRGGLRKPKRSIRGRKNWNGQDRRNEKWWRCVTTLILNEY
jgi:hypothetical protein